MNVINATTHNNYQGRAKMPSFNQIRGGYSSKLVDNRIRAKHLGNISKIKLDKIISKNIKATTTPILVRGIKILQNKRELEVDSFSYNPELVNEFDIRVKLEKEGGWNSNIILLIYLKKKSLQVEIGPKRESCNFIVRSPLSLYEAGLGSQKIPRIIHQTFIQNNVSKRMYDTVSQWPVYNPEYEYCFYDNNDCRNLIKEHFNGDILDAYDRSFNASKILSLIRCC